MTSEAIDGVKLEIFESDLERRGRAVEREIRNDIGSGSRWSPLRPDDFHFSPFSVLNLKTKQQSSVCGSLAFTGNKMAGNLFPPFPAKRAWPNECSS